MQTKAMECIKNIAEKALTDIQNHELDISKNVLKKIIVNLE